MPLSRSDQRLAALLYYASLVGEVIAYAALGVAIALMVILFEGTRARGDPVADRWPTPEQQFVAPRPFEAADLDVTRAAVTGSITGGVAGGSAVTEPPRPPERPIFRPYRYRYYYHQPPTRHVRARHSWRRAQR